MRKYAFLFALFAGLAAVFGIGLLKGDNPGRYTSLERAFYLMENR
jgi:uncharacterized membrane protein